MEVTELVRYCSELLRSADTAAVDGVSQNLTNTSESYPDRCYQTQQNTLTKYSFATEGVGLFTVAVVGVFANLLSIAVLSERTLKTKITALLTTLAIFDTVFLCCCIPVFAISSVRDYIDYLNQCVYKEGS